MGRIFILSPAHTGGERARLLFNPRAGFELARGLQRGQAAALGEIFSFLSGLYFRGKLAYAAAFARPPAGQSGSLVITSSRGLVSSAEQVTLEDLREFGEVPIDHREQRYLGPLEKSARGLAQRLPAEAEVVLLGSIGTRKYCDCLLSVFGPRLLFPIEFVGRGDMSRGGLLLRAVRSGVELEYARLAGAVRHGRRPPKLEPLPRRPRAAAFNGCAVAAEIAEEL